MPMDKNATGTFILYRDHEQIVEWLRAKLDPQAMEAENKGLKKEISELRAQLKASRRV